MTKFKSAALFIVLGVLLNSLAGSPKAAPDGTLGMTIMTAVIGSDGRVVRASGVTNVAPSSAFFDVTFNRSLADCTCIASIGLGDGGFTGGPYSAVANCPYPAVNMARIYTHDGAGLTGLPFQIIVFCPK